jgi:two-component system response regulator AtoC
MASSPLSVLVADDDIGFIDILRPLLESEGFHVDTAFDGLAAINILQTIPFDLLLLDIEMPKLNGIDVLKFAKDQELDTEIIMLTGVNDLKTALDCMKSGAFYYVTKPYSPDDLLSLIDRAMERKRLRIQNKAFRTELARRALPEHIVSQNKDFLAMLDIALRAAPSDSSVLIIGASGTGKELIANFVHYNSSRSGQPFLALNCASIPVTLIETELFGYEKGAFTDAKGMKQGLVEMANRGTLFLDEIGELPMEVQPKLLRFLQTGEYRRVGGNKNMKSDVRIVAATNADLRQRTIDGYFRQDLYYRLNVIGLNVPLLRERKEDIPLLVKHFLLKKAGAKKPKTMDENTVEILMNYNWPGNVRELENIIERAAVLCQSDVITPDDISIPGSNEPGSQHQCVHKWPNVVAGSSCSLADIQKAHVEAVLNSVKWNKELASKILGINVKTLYAKIQSYHLAEPN